MFHYFSFLPLIICFEYCSYNQCNLFIFMFYIIIIQYQNTFRQNILIKNSIVPILYLNLKFKKAIFFYPSIIFLFFFSSFQFHYFHPHYQSEKKTLPISFQYPRKFTLAIKPPHRYRHPISS